MTVPADELDELLGNVERASPFDVEGADTRNAVLRPCHSMVRKGIKWVNNIPVPVTREAVSTAATKEMIQVAISLPYEGEGDPDGLEPELFGYNKLEVMCIRLARRAASGDLAAANVVLDRILGRPKAKNVPSVPNTLLISSGEPSIICFILCIYYVLFL